ncbi:MAG: 2Fe-2S iron-sulfur cluster binding domain-containing protein [Nitrospirae bacterium]|nr:2Fe-2S iron-sulfur cluster binding domain-containing protein [Nitrospirota bacterium]
MFRPLNVTVQAHEGQTVLEVCEANQIPLEHNCGGNCACSTCHVIVRNGLDALSPADDDELDQLDEVEGLTLASRLGCQTKIFGDTEVEIPPQKHASGPATSDSELALTSR